MNCPICGKEDLSYEEQARDICDDCRNSLLINSTTRCVECEKELILREDWIKFVAWSQVSVYCQERKMKRVGNVWKCKHCAKVKLELQQVEVDDFLFLVEL